MGCQGSKPPQQQVRQPRQYDPSKYTTGGASSCSVERVRSGEPVVEQETLQSFDARARYSHRSVFEDYEVVYGDENVLGEGLNGPVRRCINKFTCQECALKVLRKAGLNATHLAELRREVNNYLKIDHPNIARLLHVYEDVETVSLVMELCTGKELFDRLAEKPTRRFSEREAQQACYQTLRAITYLHRQGIVHCDIKLENLLYESMDDGAYVKLIDFGLSKIWQKGTYLTKAQGTVAYTAPEVFNQQFTSKCDMWSLGVVVFILLGGQPPFPMRDEEEGKRRIAEGKWSFNEERWAGVSEHARDFVKALLVVDPEERLSANGALEHRWMLAIQDEVRSEVEILSPEVERSRLLSDIRRYSQISPLKRAALAVMAHRLPSCRLQRIKQTFNYLDTDHSGTITRDNFREAFGAIVDRSEETRLFENLDIVHDGEIHYSELIAAVIARHVGQDLVRETFEFFDVSRTGSITVGDLASTLGDVQGDELILQCPGSSPATGITFEQFLAYMMSAEGDSRNPSKQTSGARNLSKQTSGVQPQLNKASSSSLSVSTGVSTGRSTPSIDSAETTPMDDQFQSLAGGKPHQESPASPLPKTCIVSF